MKLPLRSGHALASETIVDTDAMIMDVEREKFEGAVCKFVLISFEKGDY